ncbi:hypothetical protein [Acinetobacter terrae]|uniref:Uncharacterized protein n=1 Tax=Acinetobacter terrae TaxID=2731247 RepID=A0A4R0ELC2_9GAMM|nr:hypothetical protein [Acinetobacter terrae]TCB58221.1 hypothetical protein E0H85_10985 [Acinetobacter terrae]
MSNIKIYGSSFVFFIFTIALILLAFFSRSEILEQNINILIVLFGLSFGWLIGIIVSPYNSNESIIFTQYTKAFTAFFSGYTIGKLDQITDEVFSPEFIFDPTNGFRLLIFISSFIISMIITFVFRQYL